MEVAKGSQLFKLRRRRSTFQTKQDKCPRPFFSSFFPSSSCASAEYRINLIAEFQTFQNASRRSFLSSQSLLPAFHAHLIPKSTSYTPSKPPLFASRDHNLQGRSPNHTEVPHHQPPKLAPCPLASFPVPAYSRVASTIGLGSREGRAEYESLDGIWEVATTGSCMS